MNNVLVAITAIILLLVGLELGLRSIFGFGNPLIYVADPNIGYLLAPNQKTRRFGNQIEINSYSMRGSAITPTRPAATLRVLLLGDSIANGGWWTDQNATISALLEQQLRTQIPDLKGLEQVEVLNASANSWSPRNELAYLQQYGSFEAQVIVLLINTDDLFGTVPTSLPVGRDRNYPAQKPPLALQEVIYRYLIPAKPIPELDAIHQEGGDRVGIILDAIQHIHALATQSHAQLLVVLTPLLREIGEPGSRDYEKKARHRLSDLLQQQQIPWIDVLPLFNAASSPADLYRDHIHLSSAGNQQVTAQIAEKIQFMLQQPE